MKLRAECEKVSTDFEKRNNKMMRIYVDASVVTRFLDPRCKTARNSTYGFAEILRRTNDRFPTDILLHALLVIFESVH